MLAFMNQNHAQFQEQITWAISLLTEAHGPSINSHSSHGSSSVKLQNPCIFNG